MFLEIILNDIKNKAEELSAITVYYAGAQPVAVYQGEVLRFVSNIIAPLIVAYLVHKLKTNYWEPKRPFFKNIINDLKQFNKK